jgi:hypothetical protein
MVLLQGQYHDACIVCEDAGHGVHVTEEHGGRVDDARVLGGARSDEDHVGDVLPWAIDMDLISVASESF